MKKPFFYDKVLLASIAINEAIKSFGNKFLRWPFPILSLVMNSLSVLIKL